MLLQSGKAELGIISCYSPCGVWAAPEQCPAFPSSSQCSEQHRDLGSTKWELTLNPQTVARTGTPVLLVAGSTSDHWQLLPCTHRKSILSLLSAWGAHTPSWVLCLCSWCWTPQGMNFPKQAGSSSSVFLSREGFSLPTVTPGLSHLQAKESPFTFPCTPSSSHLPQPNTSALQALHDNTPWSRNSGNLKRCLLQTLLMDQHFNSKQKKNYF